MALAFLTTAVFCLSLLAGGGADLRLTTALLAVGLVLCAWDRRLPGRLAAGGPEVRRLAVWLGLYVSAALISIVWSVYPQGTVLYSLDLLLFLTLLYLTAFSLGHEGARRLWGAVLLAVSLACAYGLADYLLSPGGHFPRLRLSGTFTYPNAFAPFAGCALCLLMAWSGRLPWADRPFPWWLHTVLGGLAVAALLGANSRGLLLVLPAALVLVWWGPSAWGRRLRLKRLVTAGLLGLALFSAVVLLKPVVTGEPLAVDSFLRVWQHRLRLSEPGTLPEQTDPGTPPDGLAGGEPPPGSGEPPWPGAEGGAPSSGLTALISSLSAGPGGRLAFWAAAADVIADQPLTGTGAGTFAKVHLSYQVHPRYYASEAHSHYLQVWAETGVVGVVAWLGVVVAGLLVLRSARRQVQSRAEDSDADLLRGLGGGFVLVVLHTALDLALSVPAVQAVLWLMLGTFCLFALPPVRPGDGGGRTRTRAPRRETGRGAGRRGPGLLVRVGLVGLAVVVCLPALSMATAHSGYRLASGGRWEEGLNRLFLATRLNPLDPTPHYLLATFLDRMAALSDGGGADLRAMALDELEAAIRLDPRNPNLWYVKAEVLAESGDHGAATASLRQAVDIAPYMPEYRYRLARMYADEGRHRDALTEVTEILGWWDVLMLNGAARTAVGHLEDDIYALAGESAFHLGDPQSARAFAERSLSVNPQNSAAQRLLRDVEEALSGR
ncbi:MAG TPA: hypothetical protein DHW14_09315 [Clostridiales bacterium]|nr:hypothetical protein [Clostridiales bacterium]